MANLYFAQSENKEGSLQQTHQAMHRGLEENIAFERDTIETKFLETVYYQK